MENLEKINDEKDYLTMDVESGECYLIDDNGKKIDIREIEMMNSFLDI